ncbi:MAG: anthranilate synthase component I family protein [Candidatus Hadarchaeales archaeon]
MRAEPVDGVRAILLGSGWLGSGRAAVFERPDRVLRFSGGRVRTEGGERPSSAGEFLDLLDRELDRGYFGVGFLSYEFFHGLLPDFRSRPKQPSCFPEASFALYRSFREASQEEVLDGDVIEPEAGSRMTRMMDPGRFMFMVDAVREHIRAGDVYQVNISQMFKFPFRWSPEVFLRRLYSSQPVPFACCMDFGDFGLISGSMELFLRKSGRVLTSCPIKGTRPRGENAGEDERMRGELMRSEKERAENLMIVDLMRNDIGRVCEFGTVVVNRLFDVETYSTLHQMVSEVSGRVREGVSPGEIIRATFPPGSVTGAPKVRALEIIEELEPHRRGPYCGAIGLFMPEGDFVLSVGIRVVGYHGGTGYYWAGGGITWGSVPEMEYRETLVKARAVSRAMGAELD